MRRLLLSLTLILVAAALSADRSTPAADRHPVAVKAEEGFFAAFNHDPQAKAAPLRGLWGAALTDPADVAYRIDRRHDPSQDVTIAYDDPDLGIGWPLPPAVMSARDRAGQPLAAALALLA